MDLLPIRDELILGDTGALARDKDHFRHRITLINSCVAAIVMFASSANETVIFHHS
jgi:hypothetical protein